MSYLQHELALARAAFDAANQELNRLQQQLTNLLQARADAQQRRDSARQQLAALQPVQAERDRLEPQVKAFADQEAGYVNQAGQAGQQAAAERTQAGQWRAQLTTLQTLAAQIPTLQNQVNLAQQALAAHMANRPSPYPYSPYDTRYYDWDRQRIALSNQLAAAQAALADAQNRTVAIPALQQSIATADANAASYDAQRATALQAADRVRLQAAPLRSQLAALEAQLAVVPSLQGQAQAADNQWAALTAQLTALQPNLVAAQNRVATTRVPLDDLLALAAAIVREPLDRAELTRVAATLATRLGDAQTALDWAQTRRAAATRRTEVVTARRGQRQGVLDGLQAGLNTAQNLVYSQIAQNLAAQAALQNAETARTAARNAVNQQRANKPKLDPRNKFEDPDYQRGLEPWFERLEELGQQYDAAVANVLTAREQVAQVQAQLGQAQTALAGLQNQVAVLQTELAALDTQLPGLAGEASAAQAEIPLLQARIDDYRSAREAATARLLGILPSTLPVLLLPVRVETRFATGSGGPELHLRVYPDVIHVDTHEPGLTAEEQQWREQFRLQAGAADASEELKITAWHQLAARFGARRAAWIARTLEQDRAVESREAAWNRAPHTEVLPDRWVVLGYRNGRADLTVWGPLLASDPLPVGPSPQQENGDWTAGMAWLVDFNAAVEVGMGLRIPLTADQAREGFERLIVVGVKAFLRTKDAWATADAQEATVRLTRLLDAHHYTHGLAFVPQETPTNNTLVSPAGYSSADPPSAQSYALERGAALVRAGDGSGGVLAAGALGLVDVGVFAHIQGANGYEQATAQAVNAALWPTFESALLHQLLDTSAAPAAREHFTAWVRARGPLPVLRVGNQPYGLLPAASLARWLTPATSAEAPLAARLQALWGTWRRYGARVPRTERQGELSALLCQEAATCRYELRRVSDGVPGPAMSLARGQIVAPFRAHLTALTDQAPSVLQTLVAETLDLGAYRFDAWVSSLATQRLQQLRHAQSTGIHLGSYGYVENLRPAVRAASQGYIQAPSLGHAATAAVLRSGYLTHRQNAQGAALAVDLSSERVHRARWLLDGVRQGQPLGALLGYRFERALHEHGLDQFIAPFRTLAVLHGEDALGTAMQQAQTLEAHYREAQATALAAETAAAEAIQQANAARAQRDALIAARDRLRMQRNELTAAQAAVDSSGAALTAREQAIPVYRLVKPLSRISQPISDTSDDISLPGDDVLQSWSGGLQTLVTQRDAARAVVTTRQQYRDVLVGGPGRYSTLLAALDADIGQYEGQNGSIAAAQRAVSDAEQQVNLLTERERQSHQTRDAAYANWQVAVRTLQELLAQQWTQASESVAANNVVDALVLARRWRTGHQEQRWDSTTIPWDDPASARPGLGLPRLHSDDYTKVGEQLQALDEAIDSVSDALVAEGVYQLVQGNPTRAGATLDAIATGQVAPPELEVVRTPRSGVTATHRIVALFAAPPPANPPWGADPQNPRAGAEPALNAWVASLLPDPATVRCRVDLLAPQTGALLDRTELALSVLALSPLDALYLAESPDAASQSELAQRLADARLRTGPATMPTAAEVRVDFGRDSGWSASVLSVAEFLECVRVVRALVTGARAVQAGDLALPGETASTGIDMDDLKQRADDAKIALQQAYSALTGALDTGSPNDPEPLRTALRRLAGFGLAQAVPLIPAAGYAALVAQAGSVSREGDSRLNKLQQYEGAFQGAGETALRDFHSARLRLIFGEEFCVLPRLTPAPASVLEHIFAVDRHIIGTEPLAAIVWLQRVARVRDGAARLATTYACAEALETGAQLALRVGQLPYQEPDRWIALPPIDDQSLPGGRLSLVAQLAAHFTFTQPFTGLLVDEWPEVIPNRSEVTGVAFHLHQPAAQAPQTLLLAVPPDLRPERTPAAWDLDTLAATVCETLELARARAVAPERLDATLWHTPRLTDGTWGAFTSVEAVAGRPGAWQAITGTGVGTALHLCGVTTVGHLWHTIHGSEGGWQSFGDVVEAAGNRGTFHEVACAGLNQTLHLCGLSTTGFWHTIRFADGTWQPFGNVEAVAGRRGSVLKVACAAVGNALHVCAVTDDGRLWHTIRQSDGSWLPFGDVKGQAGDPGYIIGIAGAGVSGILQLCAVTTTGLWHTLRQMDGSWQPFGDVEGQAGRRGHVEDLAVADLGSELHLRTSTNDGRVWHTIRLTDGRWTPSREVEGLGQALRLACAGIGGVLHCCDLTGDPLVPTLAFPSTAIDLTALPSSPQE